MSLLFDRWSAWADSDTPSAGAAPCAIPEAMPRVIFVDISIQWKGWRAVAFVRRTPELRARVRSACMAGCVVATAAVFSLAPLVRTCRRSLLRRFRFGGFGFGGFGILRFGFPRFALPRRDPLSPLVKTARSLNYGAGEFLGSVDADDESD
ncbi:hypothetical protein [Streptomyces sp. NPDC050988]|uniref:hypothetical protein n=1 Tax=Streptomyces sp. NPDC050988 TaxID=3365637 RepID=UPI00379C36CC